MSRVFYLALASSLLLSGCAIPLQEKIQATRVSQDALGLGAEASPGASTRWWRSFGDPQLDHLINQMLQKNPTLGEALGRMRAAQAQASASQSGLFPKITADAEESRQHFSETYIYPPPIAGGVDYIGSANLNLSWSLDFWGRQAALVSQARANANAAALDASAARLALTGALVQAYIGLDRAYKIADVAGDAEAQQSRLLKLASQRLEAGLENQIASKDAQTRLLQARADHARANAERDIILHQIAALVGSGADIYAKIERPQLDLNAALALPQSLPADLLARRPDVLAARARAEAAHSGRKAAKAAFYPDIDLIGFAGYSAIGLESMFTAPARAFGIGPALHLPIFDAGKLQADYAGATGNLDVAISSYNSTVLNAVRDVADQLTQIKALALQLDAQAQALKTAEQANALEEKRYRGGLASFIDVLNAQTLALDLRRQVAALDAAQAINRSQLLLATGGDFQPQPIKSAVNSETNSSKLMP